MKRRLIKTKLFDILKKIGINKNKCGITGDSELIEVFLLAEDLKKDRIHLDKRLMTAVYSVHVSQDLIRISFEPEKIEEFHKRWIEEREEQIKQEEEDVEKTHQESPEQEFEGEKQED